MVIFAHFYVMAISFCGGVNRDDRAILGHF
jgi:PRC-barrel domain protein